MLTNLNFYYTEEEKEKLGRLRNLIENDDKLNIGTDEILLSKFLYFANWQVEKAFQCINNFYDFKLRHPDWIAQDPVFKFREIFFYTKAKFLMPKPDRDGRAILIFKVVDAFDRYPNFLQTMIQLDDLIFEALLTTEQVQKHGFTIIYDLTNITKNVVRIFSPTNARILNEKNEVLPWTSRRIHYVQKGIIMNTAMSVFKSCLSKKLKEQIFSHDFKNLENLREMIGYENLPSLYGGPEGNEPDINYLFDFLVQKENYLLQLQNYHKIK